MNEERGFIEAITSEPTDRVVQLVYADWLTERDRPREAEAWKWIATFRRRPCEFRLVQLPREPYEAFPTNYLRPEDLHGGWGWTRWPFGDGRYEPNDPFCSWPWSAGMSTLPDELFRWLLNGDRPAWEARPFGSVLRAFDVLVYAYMQATAPRSWFQRRVLGPTWVPDWSLASQVPDE